MISIQLQKHRILASNLLPPIFRESILHHNDPDLNYIISDDFQIDLVIANRSIDDLSHVIWSCHSDFVAHSPNSILIKDLKCSTSSHIPHNIVIWTRDRSIVEKTSILLKRILFRY